MISLLGVGFEVSFVLYSYTKIELGGMGRDVRTPSSLLAVVGQSSNGPSEPSHSK